MFEKEHYVYIEQALLMYPYTMFQQFSNPEEMLAFLDKDDDATELTKIYWNQKDLAKLQKLENRRSYKHLTMLKDDVEFVSFNEIYKFLGISLSDSEIRDLGKIIVNKYEHLYGIYPEKFEIEFEGKPIKFCKYTRKDVPFLIDTIEIWDNCRFKGIPCGGV